MHRNWGSLMAFLSCSTPIATVCMNPTIDVAVQTQRVRPTHKLRTFSDREDAGGGGINVARVVQALGGTSRALVMAGGSTGRLLEELLEEDGIPYQALRISGRTRTSHSVTDALANEEYRFVAQGSAACATTEWQEMLDLASKVEAGWLVASGSLPPGVPSEFYGKLGGGGA